ncbi:MAG: bifunctional phosphoglucose/phosphomannose isomerase [Actinomycetota bacterium]|nr:bifunctional phosphoglucose/phosphomannose isomerase [Actinomycetota bacterium]
MDEVEKKENAIDLDDEEGISLIDSQGMLDVLAAFPEQMEEALEISSQGIKIDSISSILSVVVLGMGGSGISGDVAFSLLSNFGFELPFSTVKGYRLPPFVRENALVIAVSYSGNTEETLTCFEEAMRRGAKVVAISSGGKLEELASDRGVPFYKIPAGLQPRASIGYLSVPIISLIEQMELVKGLVAEIRQSIPMLRERSSEYGFSNPLASNPAKKLAKRILGSVPVIYGSEGLLSVASMRWKAQFNENAKIPAFSNFFPELNHNETVGWKNLEELCSKFHILILREEGAHPRVEKRITITSELIADSVGEISDVFARGSNPTERFLDLVYLGDWTSVYLALLLGEDPTPVKRIEELKKKLASEE